MKSLKKHIFLALFIFFFYRLFLFIRKHKFHNNLQHSHLLKQLPRWSGTSADLQHTERVWFHSHKRSSWYLRVR